MSFPLFHRPGSVVFLDDDPAYLEILAMVLPSQWPLRMFLRPAQCIYHLHREPRSWEQDRWTHQTMVDLWRQGKPLIPQILRYWARTPERYALTHVCVVDFSMPGMDGLQALSELTEWPGARILLTGQADERVAVGAFNRGLIDRYIPKQDPDVAALLTEAIETLRDRPHQQHSAIWRSTLRPDQLDLLGSADVQQALGRFAARQWVEHIVIGQPFGVLGVNAQSEVSWLQLETREGLSAAAELAELQGVDAQGVQGIRTGRCLVPLEVRQALALHGPGTPAPAFAPVEDGRLLAALIELPATVLPAPLLGHQAWLAMQPRYPIHT
ncbi:MAG: response regulator [Ramlibacter sp.]|jgi:CheY-like chemotaxis protein